MSEKKEGLPALSIPNPFGQYKYPLVAAPPSPLELPTPVPAYVLMIPVEIVTLRTRLL